MQPGARGLGPPCDEPGGGAPARRPFPTQPVQAPPFWSIAWPVTPRASGESR